MGSFFGCSLSLRSVMFLYNLASIFFSSPLVKVFASMEDVFYLHPSNNLGIMLVSQPLSSDKFQSWWCMS
ncbi:hypothetical protein CR513_25929, partial [Mucuna pruriens]